jgi:hypothetical protein
MTSSTRSFRLDTPAQRERRALARFAALPGIPMPSRAQALYKLLQASPGYRVFL